MNDRKYVEDYSKTILDNGLRVLSEYMPHLRSVSIGVWVMVGSRDETALQNGITHLIEHLVFKGTSKRTASEIAMSLEGVGGHLDAFTGKEVTCFSAHILDQHLELAIDVISDLLQNPSFPEDEFEKEKEVVLREIHHTLETPDDLIFDHFFHDIFPTHSLGYQIAGTLETVQKMTLSEIRQFMRERFTPDRIVISAAGNVKHTDLVELVKKYFQFSALTSTRTLNQPTWPNRSRHDYYANAAQTHICFGSPGYAYANPKKYPLLLLNTYLGNGMSSRLFQIVREKYGLAYSIYTFPDFYTDTGLLGVYVATHPGKAEEVIEIIQNELHQLARNSVHKSELDRLKSQLKGNLMLSLERATSRMGRLANMEIYLKDYVSLDQIIQNIDACSAASLQAIAEELFSPQEFIITILAPQASEMKFE